MEWKWVEWTEGKVVWLGGRRNGGKADGVIRPGGGFCESYEEV